MDVDSEIIAAVLGPTITAVLAMLAYGFQQWRVGRRWHDGRERAVNQATEEVRFIDTYLSALGRLADRDPEYDAKAERALNDLERSYHAMAMNLADDGPRPKSKSLTEHLAALLLLPLHRTSAKIVRVGYWVFLLLSTIWTVLVVASVGEIVDSSGWALGLLAAAILIMLGLLPALLFHALARQLDKDKVRLGPPGIGPGLDPSWWPDPSLGPFQSYFGPPPQPPGPPGPPPSWPTNPHSG